VNGWAEKAFDELLKIREPRKMVVCVGLPVPNQWRHIQWACVIRDKKSSHHPKQNPRARVHITNHVVYAWLPG